MKIVSVVGARPQFVKAAALSRVLANSFDEHIIHTGQHYDPNMSDVFFSELGIPAPAYNLGIGGGSHAEQTGQMLIKLEKLFQELQPRLVLVYGDTNSTLAGALAAAKIQIPVAHIEAGLRSFNRNMPEETNRVLTDHISKWLFCPTDTAVENLTHEGIRENVYQVGDVMYDALLYHLSQARERSTILKELNLSSGTYALATIHRVANTDNPERMRSILDGFALLETRIILPLHPRTRKLLPRYELTLPENVTLIEPISYLDMLMLEENATCILTDSGGMQKEAYLLGVRCITLRDETEWVETVEADWNRLVGANTKAICNAFDSWFPGNKRQPLYGDGQAAQAITTTLKRNLEK